MLHANQPLAFSDGIGCLWSISHLWYAVLYFLLHKAVEMILVCSTEHMYPVVSVGLPCRGLHTRCALRIPDRQYLAINQGDSPQSSLAWMVPLLQSPRDRNMSFQNKQETILIIELIKHAWCSEELERVPTCHWLRTRGCPSWFSGSASVELVGLVCAVTQPLAPTSSRRKGVCLSSTLAVTGFDFLGALNQIIAFTNFLEEFPSFPSSHHLLTLLFPVKKLLLGLRVLWNCRMPAEPIKY